MLTSGERAWIAASALSAVDEQDKPLRKCCRGDALPGGLRIEDPPALELSCVVAQLPATVIATAGIVAVGAIA